MPEKTDNKRLCKSMMVKDNNNSPVFHNYDQNEIWVDCYNCSVHKYPRDIYENKQDVIPDSPHPKTLKHKQVEGT